ncbi:DUF5677 domain-containing protein [Micromonospora aurantiaca]|uniref:DUF5677 domain-containing protein n=1 Tax=Micromonospora aurantiaca (nom. illeg.) TaxID=47850 RepID=UPI003426969C
MDEVAFAFGRTERTVDEDRMSRFFDRLDLTWSESLDANSEQRSAFRDRLAERYRGGTDAMLMLHVCAWEAAQWADEAIETALRDDSDPAEFSKYYRVIRGLFARTMLAFDEVSWLLRGGYPNGAHARVRTMHELFVIASVLAKHASPGAGHPELVDMYVRHHEVFTRSVADEIMATGVLDPEEYFDAGTLTALDAKREELIGLYGNRFKSMCGWASPLFPDGKPISMARLSGLVTNKLNYFYGLSSSHIHGGSQGWHDNFVTRGEQTALACGPTNLGLAVPGQLATEFLLGVLNVTIPSRISRKGKVDDTGALFMAGIQRIADRVIEGLASGERRVEEEERAFQAKRQKRVDV